MTVSFWTFLVGLGSIMGVLGYLTAKINNIEEYQETLFKQLNPPKFKEYDLVMFGDCKLVKCAVISSKFNKSTKKYKYKLVNCNNYCRYNNVDEYELKEFPKEKEEDEETDEDDVSRT